VHTPLPDARRARSTLLAARRARLRLLPQSRRPTRSIPSAIAVSRPGASRRPQGMVVEED